MKNVIADFHNLSIYDKVGDISIFFGSLEDKHVYFRNMQTTKTSKICKIRQTKKKNNNNNEHAFLMKKRVPTRAKICSVNTIGIF